ncbi:MAG: iron-only hydrogenase system regulator [Clostridia bacterium]|nr:iron-only hydrogenase system regulator [Clostridia bacterium]
MEKRVAVLGIIVEDIASAPKVNEVLHEYSEYIIGRMGLPHTEKNLNVISVVIDAPMDIINALSGKIGRVDGVSAKAVCATK